MTLNELIQITSSSLAKRDQTSEFRNELSRLLSLYKKNLIQIDDIEKEIIFPNNTQRNWEKLITHISKLSESLKDSVKEYYSGSISTSFTKIKNWMEGCRGNEGLLKTSIRKYSITNGTDLYRIRTNEKNKHFNPNEMFHIPYNKRGNIRTQRYSIPGYPCLYLSSTIYGCWEEMRKPSLASFKVSRIRNIEEIDLFDLRIPSTSHIVQDDYIKILRIFPLIIACSIKVINTDDTFKPEYIIPQIVLQIIIKNRKTSGINGVIYSSTQKNIEFSFNEEYLLNNIAIPVFENKPSGLCAILSEKFNITKPTSYEYELIRDPEGMFNGHVIDGGDSSSQPDDPIPYNKTVFGLLESRLLLQDLVSIETT